LTREIKVYLGLGLLVLIGVVGWFVIYHFKQAGIAEQQALDAKAQIAQTAKVQAAETLANTANAKASTHLQVALAAASAPGIIVRVCVPAAVNSRLLVPTSPSPRPPSVGSAGLPSAVGSADAGTRDSVDIAPATEKLLADATAKLTYWQHYYELCHAAGACL
jgi:hypothetical protein